MEGLLLLLYILIRVSSYYTIVSNCYLGNYYLSKFAYNKYSLLSLKCLRSTNYIR